MSTSGWFFSRLSSTNFFRDLDMTCTKQQQSTWATARRVQGEKWGSPRLTLQFSPGVGKWAAAGRVWEQGWGVGSEGQRSGKGPAPFPPRREKQTQLQPHTHSLRRAALKRQKLQTSVGLTPVACERCARSVQNEHPDEEHALSRHSAQAHIGPLTTPGPARARPFPN